MEAQDKGQGTRDKTVGVRQYQDLKAWQRGMDLVEQSYRLTATLPSHELYGLTSQIRRAAVSIPANLAEGNGREHIGDYLHHVSIAHGSLMELETHLLIALRLQYFPPDQLKSTLDLITEVGRMLGGLRKSLKTRRDAGRR